MSIQILEQTMPAAIAEACELLSAAERFDGDVTEPADIRAGLVAAEAIDLLLDVYPRYELLREDVEPLPLADAKPLIMVALDCAALDAETLEERLRIARAVRVLNQSRS